MRRVQVLFERALAHPRRSILAVTALVIVSTGAIATTAIVGDDSDRTTTTAEPDLGAPRRAPKIATTVVPSTTTTVTTTTVALTTTEAVVAPPPSVTPKPAPSIEPPPTEAPAPPAEPSPPPAPAPSPSDVRCLVRLHGKGGSGGGTYQSGDVTVIEPNGNASGWGNRQWLYFAPSSYENAAAGIVGAVDAAGCGQVIVSGFSNGGAMAMKLYCRGETFGGRLVGVVVDDPVPDHGANGCARPGGVTLTVYWTGALESTAQPGWNCAEQDWTCEGGTTVGIGAYAANGGVAPKASPHSSHTWYSNAPETRAWR